MNQIANWQTEGKMRCFGQRESILQSSSIKNQSRKRSPSQTDTWGMLCLLYQAVNGQNLSIRVLRADGMPNGGDEYLRFFQFTLLKHNVRLLSLLSKEISIGTDMLGMWASSIFVGFAYGWRVWSTFWRSSRIFAD